MAVGVGVGSPTTPRRPRRRRQAPALFNQPSANFSSGRYTPPSKNIAAQTMFRSSDPYAQGGVLGVVGQRLPYDPNRPSTMPVTVPQAPVNPYASRVMPPSILPYAAPPVAPIVPVTPGYGAAAPPGTGFNPDTAIRNAAQLFAGSVAGNPFIDPNELARMRAGYAPLEQGINPAFYRYTSPVIQQALMGLRQSVGYRPEDAAFIAQQFTPGGLQ